MLDPDDKQDLTIKEGERQHSKNTPHKPLSKNSLPQHSSNTKVLMMPTGEKPILVTRWITETSIYPSGSVTQKVFPIGDTSKSFVRKKKKAKGKAPKIELNDLENY